MSAIKTATRHAFLSPAHNGWNLWTEDGSKFITNPGESHRALESLSYALNTLSSEGWVIKQIFTERDSPNLLLMMREEEVAG